MNDADFMRLALAQAAQAEAIDEVPVGAVLVQNGQVIWQGFNQPIQQHDPTAHAEIQCLRTAGQANQNYRLPGTTLYVTVEPCAMCFGAMVHARIDRLVYGTTEPKAGVVESAATFNEVTFFNHQMAIAGGVLAEECRDVIVQFFKRRRAAHKQQKTVSTQSSHSSLG